MLKICMTRDVAITYTSTKATQGKKVLKEEPFYLCIEGIYIFFLHIAFYYINNILK